LFAPLILEREIAELETCEEQINKHHCRGKRGYPARCRQQEIKGADDSRSSHHGGIGMVADMNALFRRHGVDVDTIGTPDPVLHFGPLECACRYEYRHHSYKYSSSQYMKAPTDVSTV
jgi:hypothetical protein